MRADLLSLDHAGVSTAAITVNDVKKRLEIEDSDHDTFIDGLIKEATDEVQNACRRTLFTQTVTARYSYGRAFKLYAPPFDSITSIKTFYEGAETDEDESNFYVQSGLVSTYRMKRDVSWTASEIDEVEVVYTAGYGDSAADIPHPIKQAIEQLAAEKFMFRVSREIGTIASTVIEPGSWEHTLANSGYVVPRI